MAVIGGATAVAASKTLAGLRATPYRNSFFLVEVEGLVLGSFSEVYGLESETEVETIREGGVNYTEYKLPGQTSFSDLTLKNGVAELNVLWPWYQTVIDGDITRRSATIYLLDQSLIPIMWWDVLEAWPKSYSGPQLNASQADIAIQELVIAHHGFTEPISSQMAAAARGVSSAVGQL